MAWATRGSFTSEQAMWATEWWARHGSLVELPLDSASFLAEIVYPANRIVCDYGDRESLVLLAVLSIETGRHLALAVPQSWPGQVVDEFAPVVEPAAVDPNGRPDTEGYVILSADGLTRVKVKADEYVRLHKILTGVSSVTVWDLLRTGAPLDLLYERVPDEFAAWLNATVDELRGRYEATLAAAFAEHERIVSEVAMVPESARRKEYAARAVRSPNRATLFALLDGKDPARGIWRDLKPERTSPFVTEQVAS